MVKKKGDKLGQAKRNEMLETSGDFYAGTGNWKLNDKGTIWECVYCGCPEYMIHECGR